MPELELPKLNRDELEQLLPELAHGMRSLEELRAVDWLPWLQAKVGFEPAWRNRAAGARGLRGAQREPPRDLLRSGQAADARRPHPGAVRPGATRRASRGGRAPLVLQLLGPNYRPQQVTSDLASFWRNTYPEVKKELRRRYPKHAWPDDPLAAPATRSGLKLDLPQA